MLAAQNYEKKKSFKLVTTFILLAAAFGIILYTMVSEPGAVVDKNSLKISTLMYGVTLPLNDITEIKLSDDAPPVTRRANGIGVGNVNRGWFNVRDMGKGRLYVHMDKKPFVYIITDNDFIIINYKDASRTRNLYDELISNWKK